MNIPKEYILMSIGPIIFIAYSIIDDYIKNKKFKKIDDELNEVSLYKSNERLGEYLRNEYVTKYFNIKYPLYIKGRKPLYSNKCWKCGSLVSSDISLQCKKCGWYICEDCGTCNYTCQHGDKVRKVYNDEINMLLKLPATSELKKRYINLENNRKLIHNKIFKIKAYYNIEDKKKIYNVNTVKTISKEQHYIYLENDIKRQQEKALEVQKHLKEQQEKILLENELLVKKFKEQEEKEYNELVQKKKLEEEERIYKKNKIVVGSKVLNNKYGTMMVTDVTSDRVRLVELDTVEKKERVFHFIDSFIDSIDIL